MWDHIAEVHPMSPEGLFQQGNGVQIKVHKHGRFRKGLYHVAMNSNVLQFCDTQTCYLNLLSWYEAAAPQVILFSGLIMMD